MAIRWALEERSASVGSGSSASNVDEVAPIQEVSQGARLSSPAPQRPVRLDVVDEHPTALADRIVIDRGDVETKRIPVHHQADVDAAMGCEVDEPPRSAVHLDQLRDAVPGVPFELGVERAPIVDAGEQPVQAHDRVPSGLGSDGHGHRAVPEVHGEHPHASSHQPPTADAAAVDEPVDEEVGARRTGNVLLEHSRISRASHRAKGVDGLVATAEPQRFSLEGVEEMAGVSAA